MNFDVKAAQNEAELIRGNLRRMYPGAALYGLFFNIMLMIDSIIAGSALGEEGIFAVALGMPGYGVPVALVYALIHGTVLRMTWAKGRKDEAGFRRAFCGGIVFVAMTGLVFSLLTAIFAKELILLGGGSMAEKGVIDSAILYLGFCAPIAFFTALGVMLQESLSVLGFQSSRALLNGINIFVNLVVSILCVRFLPDGQKLAGLGIGTSAAGLAEFIAALLLFRVLKIPIRFRPARFRLPEILETIRCGVPSSVDYIAESAVMGIQNNLILAGFPGNSMILPTAEVVCNINYFTTGAIRGASFAAQPLFGVFYAGKDTDGLKQTIKNAWLSGLALSVFWALLTLLSDSWLCRLYGVSISPDIERGLFLCMLFAPFVHTVSMFTVYYEATKRFGLAMTFAVVPDSILYILIMALLIPILGKDGIWLAINGSYFLGLLLLIPAVWLLARSKRKSWDRLLLLSDEFYRRRITGMYIIHRGKKEKGIGKTELARIIMGSADITGMHEAFSGKGTGTDKAAVEAVVSDNASPKEPAFNETPLNGTHLNEVPFNEAHPGEMPFNEAHSGEMSFNEAHSGEMSFNEAHSGEMSFNEASLNDAVLNEAVRQTERMLETADKVYIKILQEGDRLDVSLNCLGKPLPAEYGKTIIPKEPGKSEKPKTPAEPEDSGKHKTPAEPEDSEYSTMPVEPELVQVTRTFVYNMNILNIRALA